MTATNDMLHGNFFVWLFCLCSAHTNSRILLIQMLKISEHLVKDETAYWRLFVCPQSPDKQILQTTALRPFCVTQLMYTPWYIHIRTILLTLFLFKILFIGTFYANTGQKNLTIIWWKRRSRLFHFQAEKQPISTQSRKILGPSCRFLSQFGQARDKYQPDWRRSMLKWKKNNFFMGWGNSSANKNKPHAWISIPCMNLLK